MNGSVAITRLFGPRLLDPSLDTKAMQPLYKPEYLVDNDSGKLPYPELAATEGVLKTYYIPGIILLGTVGNILSCVTLSGGLTSKLSANPYLVALCLSDTCFLAYLFLDWLHSLEMGFFLSGLGGWCQAMIFCSYVCTFTATWILVCLSVDRLIVVNLPGRFARLSSPLRAKIAALGVLVVAIVVYLNISVLYAERAGPSRVDCIPFPLFLRALHILGVFDVYLNVILPYLAISALSLATLCALLMHHRRRRIVIRTNDHRSRNVNFERRPRAEMQYTKLTLSLCCAFLCMTLPATLLRLYGHYTFTGYVISKAFILWQNVFLTLSSTRSAINFPLHYCCSKAFRKAFKLWVLGKPRRKYVQNRQLSTSSRLINALRIRSDAVTTAM